jgi:hypothetical protein
MTWARQQQLALLEDPIDARFTDFHHMNPHVYVRLVAMARQWMGAGHDKCSIDMLFHLLRWEHGIHTTGDQLRLNDHFTSRYARLISANEPDLSGLFNTRTLKSEWSAA